MPANPAELTRRISVSTAADTVRGMIFQGALDAVREQLGDAASAECLAQTGRKKFVDFFSYPVGDYLKLAWRAVDLLEPKLGSLDAGFFLLGQRAVQNFLAAGVGKTLLA